MAKTRFSRYLHGALPPVSQKKAASEMGFTRPVLNRLLSGGQDPTFAQIMKLAVYLDEHPARLFDQLGDDESAELCHTLIPEKGDGGAYQLCRRVRKLAARGLAQDVDEALGRIELLWEVARQAFEDLVQEMGCESACLVADHLVTDDVLYRWQCTEERASQLARDRKAQGWRRFRHSSPEIELDLFVRGGKPSRLQIKIGLSGWASSLRLALRRRGG